MVATSAPQGFYLDENAYYFQITEDGQTVIVENEAGKGFLNNAQRGSIRIEKSSDDGVIQGFTFKVEGTDFTGQPYSQTFVTDVKLHFEYDIEPYNEVLTVKDLAVSAGGRMLVENLSFNLLFYVCGNNFTVDKFHCDSSEKI